MRPRWKLVALFYGVAFGWVALIALALKLMGTSGLDMGASKATQLIMAFLYMPAPFFSALIVERIAGDGYLARYTFQGFGRKLVRVLATVVGTMAAWLALCVGLTWLLGTVFGVPGVGTLALTSGQLVANLRDVLGSDAITPEAAAQLPSPALLLVLGAATGIAAGFSINGLFAFGEEYGWRGWLMDELRPLGVFRANLLTGAMWGFWHAPVILLGFNYGSYRLAGVLMMMVFCTALSFVLWIARDFTGSLLVPAIMHGAMNGSAGFFLFLVGGGDELVAVPVGLLSAVCFALVAVVLWQVARTRFRNTLDPARSVSELAAKANPKDAVTA